MCQACGARGRSCVRAIDRAPAICACGSCCPCQSGQAFLEEQRDERGEGDPPPHQIWREYSTNPQVYTIIPQADLEAHFCTVDNSALFEMLQFLLAEGVVPKHRAALEFPGVKEMRTFEDFKRHAPQVWLTLFPSMPKLSGDWKFAGELRTDGYAFDFVYHRERAAVQAGPTARSWATPLSQYPTDLGNFHVIVGIDPGRRDFWTVSVKLKHKVGDFSYPHPRTLIRAHRA